VTAALTSEWSLPLCASRPASEVAACCCVSAVVPVDVDAVGVAPLPPAAVPLPALFADVPPPWEDSTSAATTTTTTPPPTASGISGRLNGSLPSSPEPPAPPAGVPSGPNWAPGPNCPCGNCSCPNCAPA